jgi:FAD/FMN-containing dehydrogenase
MSDPLVDALRQVAPTVDDASVCAGYGQDWTGRFAGPVRAVVRPTSTAEVAAALRVCAQAGAPVVPQGGNTGIVGGSVPGPDDAPAVIISTTRLDAIAPVDPLARTVVADAGATLARLHAHAADAGLAYGVDLAARDSATIGGTVATNAGGIRVCAYGMTRAQVVGLEAVLGDGSVISRLLGLPKDNTGYDLAGLLTGSEGTLGVITKVMVRLHPQPGETMVMLAGVDSLADALRLVHASVPAGARLLGAETIDAAGMDLVCDFLGLAHPLRSRWPYVLLLEATELDPPSGVTAVVGADTADKRALWRLREEMTNAVSTLGVAHKLDASVPLANLDALADGVRDLMPPTARLTNFGHLADGNLHIEINDVDPADETLDHAIFELVARLGGAVSAEHGVGRAKAAWLGLSRTPAEVAAMRGIKAALDPAGVLNPGVLLPPTPAA